MSVRNDELCVAGVGFEGREVTLLHGLQAASGAVLEQDAVVEFSQGEKPAFVGFSGDGVILPREDSDGVGLETVNVTRLKLEVWRVPGRNLVRKSISAPQAGPTMIFPRTGRSDRGRLRPRRARSGPLGSRRRPEMVRGREAPSPARRRRRPRLATRYARLLPHHRR